MKSLSITIFLLVITTTLSFSQKLNTIPNVDIREFPNGWHQFQAEFITFDVEIIDGRMVQGTIIWPDKSSYQGYLNHTEISGRGTYKWPNGMRYEGRFDNHGRHGKGSFILQDDTKWYGKWKNNKKNGKGKVYDAKGNLKSQGIWENDKLVATKKK